MKMMKRKRVKRSVRLVRLSVEARLLQKMKMKTLTFRPTSQRGTSSLLMSRIRVRFRFACLSLRVPAVVSCLYL